MRDDEVPARPSLEPVSITGDVPVVCQFTTDELTAVCPFDFGGPDFYETEIRYEVTETGVESRSLKAYVEWWRDREVTAETLAQCIYEDVRATVSSDAVVVKLQQARRGGIEETVVVGDGELL